MSGEEVLSCDPCDLCPLLSDLYPQEQRNTSWVFKSPVMTITG